jgi:predicted MFS family arabinose efflux permease
MTPIGGQDRFQLPQAAPGSLISTVLQAFLATAGVFYVNIVPALVSGLVDELHFTSRQAGEVAAANVYGAAIGALIIVFFIRKIPWRAAAVIALLALIAADFLSTLVVTPTALMVVRFLHGLIGGALVGIGYSVIARSPFPDRTFGMLLFVQFGLGGLGLIFLPHFVHLYGAPVLFLALAAFSAVTLLMLPFLADNPPPKIVQTQNSRALAIACLPLMLALAGLFLFQAGKMAVTTYAVGLGRSFGLQDIFINSTLGISGWVGALGSFLVIIIGPRFGRTKPLICALPLTIAGTFVLHFGASPVVFAAVNVVTTMTWAFVLPYLLSMCAAFDSGGQSAALGGFFSKMGLATGPLVGAAALGQMDYGRLINSSIAVLLVSMVAILLPARLLDKKAIAPVPAQRPLEAKAMP